MFIVPFLNFCHLTGVLQRFLYANCKCLRIPNEFKMANTSDDGDERRDQKTRPHGPRVFSLVRARFFKWSKIFGLWKRHADFHLLNHFLILAKQHIYSCRNKGYPPSFKTYLAKVSSIYQIETTIADSNDERTFHDVKWKKFLLNFY